MEAYKLNVRFRDVEERLHYSFSIRVDKENFVIGYGIDYGCDLSLGGLLGYFDFGDGLPPISRQHCELKFDKNENKIFVRDLGSRTGTYLNNKRLSRKEEISDYVEVSESDVISFANKIAGIEIKISLLDFL